MAFYVISVQVKSKLKGHQKRITGLAFSTSLNILVSSGADAQVSDFIFWSISLVSVKEQLQKANVWTLLYRFYLAHHNLQGKTFVSVPYLQN